jgi:hypothetical protein
MACIAGFYAFTVEIPHQSMLVRRGSADPSDIVATFPQSTRLSVWDARLVSAEILPYWRWEFDLSRDLEKFRYTVSMSIMGTPEEGLMYRDKALANWRRPELEQWAGRMLHRFEADSWDEWSRYRTPPTEDEERQFSDRLLSYFERSAFANQGIHVEQVVVGLPSPPME